MKYKILFWMIMLLTAMAGALAVHDDSTCQATSVTEEMVNVVVYSDTVPDTVVEGQTLRPRVQTDFSNMDVPDEEITVEVGMYPANSPQALATVLFATTEANPTRNCVPNEDFVDTIHVQAKSGEIADVEFEIQAPVDSDLNNGGTRQYIVQAVAFKNCYRQCGDANNVYEWHSRRITLVDDPDLSADSNNDGVQNGDETDLDCGGSSGNACEAGFSCEQDSDCESSLECRDLGSGKVCTSPTSQNLPGGLSVFTLLILGVIGYGIWRLIKK